MPSENIMQDKKNPLNRQKRPLTHPLQIRRMSPCNDHVLASREACDSNKPTDRRSIRGNIRENHQAPPARKYAYLPVCR
jgi:hypothetical protein